MIYILGVLQILPVENMNINIKAEKRENDMWLWIGFPCIIKSKTLQNSKTFKFY